MVGSNDIDKSTCFFDSILCHSGLQKQEITEDYIGCAQNKKNAQVEFYLQYKFIVSLLETSPIEWIC